MEAEENSGVKRTNAMPWRQYISSRFTTLEPPMDRVVNPIKALRMLNCEQWNFFGCAWSGWIMDSFDFFTVSLTLPQLATEFNKNNSDMTWRA